MNIYKIRKKGTELYSTGGSWPKFAPSGKIWKTKAALSAHLSLVRDVGQRGVDPYYDCEIVILELVETPVEIVEMSTYRNALAQRADDRKRAEERRIQAYKEAREREELARLQAKYN